MKAGSPPRWRPHSGVQRLTFRSRRINHPIQLAREEPVILEPGNVEADSSFRIDDVKLWKLARHVRPPRGAAPQLPALMSVSSCAGQWLCARKPAANASRKMPRATLVPLIL